MVAALQSHRHVVAMTGDWVNDVLALKDADIGVAMGNGSATRAVAHIVLLDSKFSVMPSIVAEGRRLIGNIERGREPVPDQDRLRHAAVGRRVIVARLPFPFLPRHLTLVGTLTIGTPAFFIALRPNARRATPGFVMRVMRFAVPCWCSSSGWVVSRGEPGTVGYRLGQAAGLRLSE